MATVRVTNELKYGVRNVIQNMYNNLLNDTKNKFRPLGDTIYNSFIPAEHRQYMDLLPETYFDQARDLAIHIDHGDYSLTTTVVFSDKKRIPREFANSYAARTVNLDDPKYAQLVPVLLPILTEYRQLEAKQKALTDHADNLMRNNGTVGLILKAWPQFIELLPDWAKKKHNEVSEKRTREATTLDEATVAELNTSLMIGKLAGG